MTASRIRQINPGELVRFGFVGVVNTAVGLSVILAGIALGLDDISANVTGYLVGLATSFVLNRRWTFRYEERIDARLIARYSIAFLVAYLANLTVALSLIHAGLVPRPAGHIIAAGIYTAVFYALCRSFVFTRPRAGLALSGDVPRIADLFALLLIAITGLLIWLLRDIPLGHDQSWYLIAVAKVLHGAWPYIDVIDVNPPLAFYMYLPPVFVAERLGLSPDHAFVAYILILACLSALWARLHLLETPGLSRPYANFAAFLAFAVVIAFPIHEIGQRDPLMMIFALPYLALSIRRLEGGDTTRGSAIATGLWSALGFCLKPHFLIFPIVTEITLLLHRRQVRGWLRPELLAIGAAGAVYAVTAFALFPAYFDTIVPIALLTYFAYGAHFPITLLRPEIAFCIIAIAAYAVLRRRRGWSRSIDLLAAWTVAAFVTYLAQNKGFPYHIMPLRVVLVFLLVSLFVARIEIGRLARITSKTIVGTLLVLLCLTTYSDGLYRDPWADAVRQRIETLGAHDGLYTFTAHVFIGFPLANRIDGPWVSRFSALWPIPGAEQILATPQKFTPEQVLEARKARRYVIDAVVGDFERHAPGVVIVDARDTKPYFGGVKYDYLADFEKDPDFARIWRSYALADSYNGFQIWRKIAPVNPAVTGP